MKKFIKEETQGFNSDNPFGNLVSSRCINVYDPLSPLYQIGTSFSALPNELLEDFGKAIQEQMSTFIQEQIRGAVI